MIETFLSQYPATISAISACATAGAVIVALYLARSQSRARLKIFADINVYISSEAQTGSPIIDTKNAPRMISVTIKNVGAVAISISYWSSFAWSVVGSKEMAMQNQPNRIIGATQSRCCQESLHLSYSHLIYRRTLQ